MSSRDSEFSVATCPYQTPRLIQVNVYSFLLLILASRQLTLPNSSQLSYGIR